jgi:hypothetical protein
MAALGAFATRQRAAEGHWFNTEGQLAVMRHLEKLVQQGKVDASLLEAARRSADETSSSGLPTEVINRRKEYVYEHKAGLVPGQSLHSLKQQLLYSIVCCSWLPLLDC